jgi:hypothetical protein
VLEDVGFWTCGNNLPQHVDRHFNPGVGDPEKNELRETRTLAALVENSLPGLCVDCLDIGGKFFQRFFHVESVDIVAKCFRLKLRMEEPSTRTGSGGTNRTQVGEDSYIPPDLR